MIASGVFRSGAWAAVCSARCCSSFHWLCRLAVSWLPIVCIARNVSANSLTLAPETSISSGRWAAIAAEALVSLRVSPVSTFTVQWVHSASHITSSKISSRIYMVWKSGRTSRSAGSA